MSGIYIHIPFCRQACHYCDFHFSTNFKNKSEMMAALVSEMELRKDYLNGAKVKTIYLGGGTPSVLDQQELDALMNAIREHFVIEDQAEITLEANPDDLDVERLRVIRSAGINRLSIGIQTFDDHALKYLNRTHSSQQAATSLDSARAAGFDNISIDLMFALPPISQSSRRFTKDLETVSDYKPEHVSLYGLTIESETVFGRWAEKGKLEIIDENDNATQYLDAIQSLESAGYIQYEVSNFCQPGLESKHNSSYWLGAHYLGIGPGAHSYNGSSRSHNFRNNSGYIRSIQADQLPSEVETLSPADQMNEYVLTRIRTRWGIDLDEIQRRWGVDLLKSQETFIEKMIDNKQACLDDEVLRLTPLGLSIADEVALRLFNAE